MMTLKNARHASGFSQSELAELVGASQTQISFWEKGTGKPTKKQINRMNQVLSEEVDWTSEFEEFDLTEKLAAFSYAKFLSEEVNDEAAVKLVFNNTKFNVRKLLKGTGICPRIMYPAKLSLLL